MQESNETVLDAQAARNIDAYWRAANFLSVGQIYLCAIPLLKDCLATECDLALTVPQLQQYPGWDRLRGDARFQALIKEPPPTEKRGAR